MLHQKTTKYIATREGGCSSFGFEDMAMAGQGGGSADLGAHVDLVGDVEKDVDQGRGQGLAEAFRVECGVTHNLMKRWLRPPVHLIFWSHPPPHSDSSQLKDDKKSGQLSKKRNWRGHEGGPTSDLPRGGWGETAAPPWPGSRRRC